MRVSSNRAFQLLREMAYERVSCSENEEKAANRLLEEARSIGAQAHMETTMTSAASKATNFFIGFPSRKNRYGYPAQCRTAFIIARISRSADTRSSQIDKFFVKS